MDKPTCGTCPYWTDRCDDGHGAIGSCRRLPPVLVPGMCSVGEDGDIDHWRYLSTRRPMTDEHDFCGEHPSFPAWMAEQRKEKTSGK